MSFEPPSADGGYNDMYDQTLSFNLNDKSYLLLYVYNAEEDIGRFEIRNVRPSGQVEGGTRDSQSLKWKYVLTIIEFGPRTYLLAHTATDNNYFIQELAGGKFGKETDKGGWDAFYPSFCSFKVGHVCFLMRHTHQEALDYKSLIQTVNIDGKLEEVKDESKWKETYHRFMPFEFGGDFTYVYCQTTSGESYITQKVSVYGIQETVVKETSGTWLTTGPFKVEDDDDIYICRHREGYAGGRPEFYMNRLNKDGTIGGPSSGYRTHDHYCPVLAPMHVEGNTYLYAQDTEKKYFSLPVVKPGKKS